MIFACLLTGLIKAVRFAKGTVHDFKMLENSNISIHEKIKILADLGFLGIHKKHKNAVIPHKKTKLKPLSDEQKQENKRQASQRVAIEHLNRDCKIFRICSSRYRGKHKNYQDTWLLVTAIVNFKKSTKHFKYQTF